MDPGDRREDAARWEIGSISDMAVFSALIGQHMAWPAAWRSLLRFSRGNTAPPQIPFNKNLHHNTICAEILTQYEIRISK
jgi:hypothetical protein